MFILLYNCSSDEFLVVYIIVVFVKLNEQVVLGVLFIDILSIVIFSVFIDEFLLLYYYFLPVLGLEILLLVVLNNYFLPVLEFLILLLVIIFNYFS